MPDSRFSVPSMHRLATTSGLLAVQQFGTKWLQAFFLNEMFANLQQHLQCPFAKCLLCIQKYSRFDSPPLYLSILTQQRQSTVAPLMQTVLRGSESLFRHWTSSFISVGFPLLPFQEHILLRPGRHSWPSCRACLRLSFAWEAHVAWGCCTQAASRRIHPPDATISTAPLSPRKEATSSKQLSLPFSRSCACPSLAKQVCLLCPKGSSQPRLQ